MALSEKLQAELREIVGAAAVHADAVALLAYSRDAGAERGRPDAVVLPQNAGQVAALARWAAQHAMPVVGWGAGTGQTGGAMAHLGGLLIAFRNMRRVLELDVEDGQVLTEPGIITAHLDRAARDCGLLYPPDPASDRASSIGGNIAENSGGPRCCRYGVTAHYVLGLETVLPDGARVAWGGAALDVPEPNFLDLLVGSEGTLALVTAARLRLVRRPEAGGTLMASFPSPEAAAQAVSAIIRTGLRPTALEMLDRLLYSCVVRSGAGGLAPGAGALLIAEVEGYRDSLPGKLRQMAEALQAYGPLEVRLAAGEAEREAIWYARKSAFAATAWLAPDDVSMDVVVPRSRLPEAFREISRLGGAAGFQVGYLAHAGDGNIHPEIFCDLQEPGARERVNALQDEIIHYVLGLGGSFTGEHGVGLEKRRHMAEMYGAAEIGAMQDVKAVFDPGKRLNPGKIFPETRPAGPSAAPAAGRQLAARLRPASVPELQELLAELQAQRQPAWLGGSGTKCAPPGSGLGPSQVGGRAEYAPPGSRAEYAAPGSRAGAEDPGLKERSPVNRAGSSGSTLISTTGLTGILTKAYDDLFVAVAAGARVAEVAASVAADGFVFPLAAPWPDATVGGTVAAAFNAPWRSLYGGIRENLLCAEVVLPDGRLVRLGRPLVKDVAGYSLHKLFIGSFGALGALTSVALRVYPRPQATGTWRVACEDLGAAVAAARILGREAEVLGALLLDGRRAPGDAPFAAICTYAGPAEDVAAAAAASRCNLAQAKLPAPEPMEAGMAVWAQALGLRQDAPQLLVRAGVAPGAMQRLLAAGEAARAGACLADLAHGLAYFSTPEPAADPPAWERAIRAAAQAAGGYALALGRGTYPPRGLQTGPEARRMLGELKRRWDPAGILNAGVFSQLEEESRGTG